MSGRKLLFFIAAAFFICTSSFAQLFSNVVYNRKAVYGEVLGTSLGASLNYEYLFVDNGLKQGFRFGPGYFVNFFEKNSPTIISGNFEYVAFGGARDHHFEYGLGLTYQYKYYKDTWQTVNYYVYGSDTIARFTDHDYKYQRTGPALVPRIGYRYESPDGGLVVRVGYTPLIYFLNKEKEFYDGAVINKHAIPFATKLAWGGVSIGFSFY